MGARLNGFSLTGRAAGFGRVGLRPATPFATPSGPGRPAQQDICQMPGPDISQDWDICQNRDNFKSDFKIILIAIAENSFISKCIE